MACRIKELQTSAETVVHVMKVQQKWISKKRGHKIYKLQPTNANGKTIKKYTKYAEKKSTRKLIFTLHISCSHDNRWRAKDLVTVFLNLTLFSDQSYGVAKPQPCHNQRTYSYFVNLLLLPGHQFGLLCANFHAKGRKRSVLCGRSTKEAGSSPFPAKPSMLWAKP